MNPALVTAANLTARFLPHAFKARVRRQFMRPRARKQTDRGRDWLETLSSDTFKGPQGDQHVYCGGNGPLVVFQHGWEADSADLSTLAKAVMSSGYRVALIDGPAHGGSKGQSANLLVFAEGLRASVDLLGQPHALIAHSMGLPATVIAMARYGLKPGRVVGLGAPDSLVRNVMFQGHSAGMSERAITLMLQAISEAFGEPAENLDITRDAPNFDTPALILHGENDQIASFEAAHRIATSWPGAQAEIFGGIGHRGILRDDRIVEQVLGFLD